jgi:hypothetical protein
MARHNRIILPDGASRQVDVRPFQIAQAIESIAKREGWPRHALIGACLLLIGSLLGTVVSEFDALASADQKDA